MENIRSINEEEVREAQRVSRDEGIAAIGEGVTKRLVDVAGRQSEHGGKPQDASLDISPPGFVLPQAPPAFRKSSSSKPQRGW